MKATTFGNRLKELRLERGLHQIDLANFLSVSLRQYQRYENDESDISLSRVIMLAEYYDISLDYLTGRSHQRNTI